MAIPTSQGLVQRYAMGLYGLQLGSATMSAVLDEVKTNGGITKIDSIFNWYYAVSFGTQSTTEVAGKLAANLGIVTGENGLTAGFVEFATGYIKDVLDAANPNERGAAVSSIISAWENLSGNAEVGAAVAAWQATVDNGLSYAAANTADAPVGTFVTTFNLGVGNDNITGTAGDDLFVSNFSANGNTLESGDNLNGGAGADTLKAIMTSAPFAATPTVSGIEHITVTAQNDTGADSGQNNTSANFAFDAVQLDFGRVSGVETIENFDSRADLIVEDVRIQKDQITKDITIEMRDTDPGNVDFGVYFDQNSLRTTSASTSTIRLQVMDTASVVKGTAPLLNSPYGGFVFTATDANGVSQVVTLKSDAIDAAQTYTELRDAFQAAADAQFGAGAVAVTLGAAFDVADTTTTKTVTGTEINISATGKYLFTTPADSGWLANGVVPANSGLHTNFFNTPPQTSTDLVTSTIVLDNVGRGSNGGDLVVGGLSVGDTSNSKGVQQFDIKVEDNSKLQTISSTNNTLQVVNIVNGTTDEGSDAYTTTLENAGNLTVNGTVALSDTPLPGATSAPGAAGFTDVRVIDASAMTGKFEFTAELTAAAVGKYLNLVDTAENPAADNIAVAYSGGANNDTMVVNIDGSVLASNSNINPGREDFTFAINGNTGDDKITVAIDSQTGFQDWYTNQQLNKNVTIDGGAGNDTIRKPGAGDAKILGGAGDDTIYAENTGGMTAWVLNAVDNDLADLESNENTFHQLHKAKVAVTFKGFTVTADIASTGYKSSDLQINQAIKAAINGDAVLSKLLVAEDGPANSLVVKSLIDGEHVAADLGIAINAPAAADLSAADVTAIATAWGVPVATAAAAVALMQADAAASTAAGASYAAKEESLNADFNSASVSDNTITGDVGNDVIVLGTNAFSNDTLVYAGFENGRDSVVNFDTGNRTVTTEIDTGRRESFTVTFKDITASVGETLTFDGVTVNLNDGAAGLVPAADVALAFAEQYGSAFGAQWAVQYDAGSKSVTLTNSNAAQTPIVWDTVGNVKTDVVTADFNFSTAANDGSAEIGSYVQGLEAAWWPAVTSTTFTLDFDASLDGTAVIANKNGSIAYEGATIEFKAGDGAVTLASAFAKAAYTNWTAELNANATSVTFTAKVAGSSVAIPAAPLSVADGIDPVQFGILGAEIGGGVYTVTTDVGNAGIDRIDFSSYGVVGVQVGAVLEAGNAAAAGQKYVLLTESTTNAGEYNVEVYTEAGATDTLVGKVGVIDFGATQDFQATNFIL